MLKGSISENLPSSRLDDLDVFMLNQAFAHINSAVIVADLSRKIVMVNAAATSLFGYSEEELLNQSTRMLYADESNFYKTGKDRFNPTAKKENEASHVQYRCKSGRIFQGQTSGGAIKNISGNNAFYIGIILDESYRLSAEETLNQLHKVTSSRDLNYSERVQAILELGCTHFQLPIGIVSKISGNHYEVQNATHPDDALSAGMVFDLTGTYCCHVFKANDVQGFHHVAQSSIAKHPCYENFGLEAYLGAPIFVDGERYGTLNFSSVTKTRSFIRQDYELIRLFSEWVGHEIARNKDLFALEVANTKLVKVASTDELTGLANRRSIEQVLNEQLSYCQSLGSNMSVALIDFDDFKAINDTYGHTVGDDSLRLFSDIAKSHCRKNDCYGRWGGEEFLAVLPQTDLHGASLQIKRIQDSLKNSCLIQTDSAINLTLSVGITEFHPNDRFEDILMRVDKLMYQAKRRGKNCIETG
ncbi:diguanylate cyclase [Vibrio sp. 03-59-1]|uniref:sensor domain-containing diguanylate cyclase n=1 Tax=Vibrio sp. 03-59-1 TaxID=2607607 RepID=UPI001493BAF5|nr:diguanylate cyclase [Vibrio sp. 03-59-1]NOH82343.1 diguanylate cyclase [Vibrio sp. 03-59-1]